MRTNTLNEDVIFPMKTLQALNSLLMPAICCLPVLVLSIIVIAQHILRPPLSSSCSVYPPQSYFNMDQLLSAYGVHSGLSQDEFVQLLEIHDAETLRSLRISVFSELKTISPQLVPTDAAGLPLVTRKDSALRPVTNVLSKDIWCISISIKNNSTLQRTLFMNGIHSASFLKDVPRKSKTKSSQSINDPPTSHSHQSNPNPSLSQPPQTPHPTPPPRSSDISNLLLSRELNEVKDSLKSIRCDITHLKNQPLACFPDEVQSSVGKEIKNLREEVQSLQRHVYNLGPHLNVNLNSTQHTTQDLHQTVPSVHIT